MAVPPPIPTTRAQQDLLNTLGDFLKMCAHSGIPVNPFHPLWGIIDNESEILNEDEKAEIYERVIKLLITVKNIK